MVREKLEHSLHKCGDQVLNGLAGTVTSSCRNKKKKKKKKKKKCLALKTKGPEYMIRDGLRVPEV